MLAGSPKIWICLTEDSLRQLVKILKGMVGPLIGNMTFADTTIR